MNLGLTEDEILKIMEDSDVELSSDSDDYDDSWIPTHRPKAGSKDANSDSESADDENICSGEVTIVQTDSHKNQRKLYFKKKIFTGKPHPPQKDYSCCEVSDNILVFFFKPYKHTVLHPVGLLRPYFFISRHPHLCDHHCSIFLTILPKSCMNLGHSIQICIAWLRMENL